MVYRSGATVRPSFALICGVAMVALLSLLPGRFAAAQEATQTGTINGRVVDERGAGISGAQVFLVRPAIGSQTGADGNYSLRRVPAGTHTVGVRMLGFRPDSASVTVAGGRHGDAGLHPRPRPAPAPGDGGDRYPVAADQPRRQRRRHDAQRPGGAQAAPRSTTEMLRYVPGFTRVESSGGEVNQNIVIRGILGPGVRDVHGGRDAGVSHHAHLLHERRQPLPLRREHRADGGGAGRRLGPVRFQHARRHHQLHQQDRRGSSSPAPCGRPAAPTGWPGTI